MRLSEDATFADDML